MLIGRPLPASRIYLDHAATTPLLACARDAMIAGLERWANPSSPHAEGRAARAALEGARERIRAALGWPHRLIFTSGATEAAAIALTRQARPRPALLSAVEHAGVLRQRPDARTIAVGKDGIVDAATLGAALHGMREPVVAVQHVNSETGFVQPIGALAGVVAGAGGVLFVDCAQSAGKLALPRADLIAVSAHKLGGPPGIGALLVRDLGVLAPIGAGQEQGYRLGTENLPAILGFAAAAEASPPDGTGFAPWVGERLRWRVLLDNAVQDAGGTIVGGHILTGTMRSPLIGSYRLPGVAAAAQLIRLDLAGIAVSAGSACSSGSLRPSHVLRAIGIDEHAAREVIRVSFGRGTTWDEIDRFATAYRGIAAGARAA